MEDELSDFLEIANKYLNDIPFLCSSYDKNKSLLENKEDCLAEEVDRIQYDEKALKILNVIKQYIISNEDEKYASVFARRYPMITWIVAIAKEYQGGISIVVMAAEELPSALIPLLDDIVNNPNIGFYIGNVNLSKFLLYQYPHLKPDLTNFDNYARQGLVFPFVWLLDNSEIPISRKDVLRYFSLAGRYNKLNLIKFLVEEFPDDKEAFLEAFNSAANKGAYEVVKFLLPRIDSLSSIYFQLSSALTPFFEEPEIFRLLLKDPRVDPSFQDNKLIYEALDRFNMFSWAIYTLLKHPRIKLSSEDYKNIFDEALDFDDIDIVEIILIKGHVEPTREMVEYVENMGYYEMAHLLLKYMALRP